MKKYSSLRLYAFSEMDNPWSIKSNNYKATNDLEYVWASKNITPKTKKTFRYSLNLIEPLPYQRHSKNPVLQQLHSIFKAMKNTRRIYKCKRRLAYSTNFYRYSYLFPFLKHISILNIAITINGSFNKNLLFISECKNLQSFSCGGIIGDHEKMDEYSKFLHLSRNRFKRLKDLSHVRVFQFIYHPLANGVYQFNGVPSLKTLCVSIRNFARSQQIFEQIQKIKTLQELDIYFQSSYGDDDNSCYCKIHRDLLAVLHHNRSIKKLAFAQDLMGHLDTVDIPEQFHINNLEYLNVKSGTPKLILVIIDFLHQLKGIDVFNNSTVSLGSHYPEFLQKAAAKKTLKSLKFKEVFDKQAIDTMQLNFKEILGEIEEFGLYLMKPKSYGLIKKEEVTDSLQSLIKGLKNVKKLSLGFVRDFYKINQFKDLAIFILKLQQIEELQLELPICEIQANESLDEMKSFVENICQIESLKKLGFKLVMKTPNWHYKTKRRQVNHAIKYCNPKEILLNVVHSKREDISVDCVITIADF